MGYGSTGTSIVDTASYTPHLSLNSLFFPSFFFLNFAMLDAGFGWAKEFFYNLALIIKSWWCPRALSWCVTPLGQPWARPMSLTPVWGTVLGSTGIISKMKQSHGASWNFVHQHAELRTWTMPWLLGWFSSGVMLVAGALTPKKPPKHKKNEIPWNPRAVNIPTSRLSTGMAEGSGTSTLR